MAFKPERLFGIAMAIVGAVLLVYTLTTSKGALFYTIFTLMLFMGIIFTLPTPRDRQ